MNIIFKSKKFPYSSGTPPFKKIFDDVNIFVKSITFVNAPYKTLNENQCIKIKINSSEILINPSQQISQPTQIIVINELCKRFEIQEQRATGDPTELVTTIIVNIEESKQTKINNSKVYKFKGKKWNKHLNNQ